MAAAVRSVRSSGSSSTSPMCACFILWAGAALFLAASDPQLAGDPKPLWTAESSDFVVSRRGSSTEGHPNGQTWRDGYDRIIVNQEVERVRVKTAHSVGPVEWDAWLRQRIKSGLAYHASEKVGYTLPEDKVELDGGVLPADKYTVVDFTLTDPSGYKNADDYSKALREDSLFSDSARYIPVAYYLIDKGDLTLRRAFLDEAEEQGKLNEVLDYFDVEGLSVLGYALHVNADVGLIETLQAKGADLYSLDLRDGGYRTPVSVMFAADHPLGEQLLANRDLDLWKAIQRDNRVMAHIFLGFSYLHVYGDKERVEALMGLIGAESRVDPASGQTEVGLFAGMMIGVAVAAVATMNALRKALGCDAVVTDVLSSMALPAAGKRVVRGALPKATPREVPMRERAESSAPAPAPVPAPAPMPFIVPVPAPAAVIPASESVPVSVVLASEPASVSDVTVSPKAEDPWKASSFLLKRKAELFQRIRTAFELLRANDPTAAGMVVSKLAKFHTDPRDTACNPNTSLGDLQAAFKVLKRQTNVQHYAESGGSGSALSKWSEARDNGDADDAVSVSSDGSAADDGTATAATGVAQGAFQAGQLTPEEEQLLGSDLARAMGL